MALSPQTALPRHDPAAIARAARRLERRERAAYLTFAGLGVVALVVVALVAVYVVRKAWPAFEHNGVSILGNRAVPGMDEELNRSFSGFQGQPYRELHAWPAIYGTLLTTGGAVLLSVPFSILAAIFVAELAPRGVLRVVEPVVRLLAAVPSVVWGLFALLVLAPWVDRFLIPDTLATDYASSVALTGSSFLLGVLVLTLMIAPFEISIFTDALRAVPDQWRQGGRALGLDTWRTVVRISLPVIRPAIVAGTVLATGRAIGEAIALSMAAGGVGFIPNPLDGFTFFLEPVRPLASAIVDYQEGIGAADLEANLFAFGTMILVSALALMLAARLIVAPIRSKGSP
ncbi:MAG: ABC transporter permease subunit [Thermoleophilia bacterium]